MEHLADSFLYASGRLQTLCYKMDIEASLRTPGMAGFQLLGLNDFPGQVRLWLAYWILSGRKKDMWMVRSSVHSAVQTVR